VSGSPFEPELLFATPLFTAGIQAFETRRDALVADLLALRDAHPTADGRSVRGGWHSGALFHSGAPESVRWLLGECLSYARTALAPAYGEWRGHALRLGSAWATVLGPTAYNSPHHHRPQTWSGVIWVQVPPIPADAAPGASCLELFHPSPDDTPFGRGSVLLTPTEGRLALFPGHLLHTVHPSGAADEAPRIAVAFNLGITSTGR
jgi:uncharacterized protein (TIGR02466 family)